MFPCNAIGLYNNITTLWPQSIDVIYPYIGWQGAFPLNPLHAKFSERT